MVWVLSLGHNFIEFLSRQLLWIVHVDMGFCSCSSAIADAERSFAATFGHAFDGRDRDCFVVIAIAILIDSFAFISAGRS